MKFDIIPYHDNYRINKNGNIVDSNGCTIKPFKKKNELYVNIDKIDILVSELVVLTFYGMMNASIGFKDGNHLNVTRENVYYIIETITKSTDCIFINNEEFRKIPGYSRYYMNEWGVIYSEYSRRIISHKYNEYPYPIIQLTSDENCIKQKRVHRLVYITWVGPLDDEEVINHKDERMYHTHFSNLEKCDMLYNTRYSIKSGRKYVPFTLEVVDEILRLHSIGKSDRQIIESLKLDKKMQNTIRSLIYRSKKGEVYQDIISKYSISKDIKSRPKSDLDTIRKICQLLQENTYSMNEISRICNVSDSTVARIKHRERWKDISKDYSF